MLRKYLAVNLMLLTLPCTGGSEASGNDGLEPEVMIRLLDAGLLPVHLKAQGKAAAGKILGSAGVRVRWAEGQRKPQPAVPTIDLRFAYTSRKEINPDALAEALPYAQRGVRITVYFDRLAGALRSRQASAGAILGHVLAHEIGHVLLGVVSHADRGLMKAYWSDQDYAVMSGKGMRFTPEDEQAIRLNFRYGGIARGAGW